MQRKLVRQGTSTMMISLPSKWIKENKLDKGSIIELTEDQNNLTISTSGEKENTEKARIDVTDLSPLINRALIAIYVQGIDEIEVIFKNKDEIKDFSKKMLPELLGFEIVKQTSSSIVLKDITGCDKQEVDALIKRIILILDSIAEEIIKGVKDKPSLSSAIEADVSVNRLTNFCLRVLNKKGYPLNNRTSQIYGILNLLEDVGDSLKKIAQVIENNPKSVNKKHIEYIEESRVLLNYYNDLIFVFDKEKLVECAKRYSSLKKKLSLNNVMDSLILQLINSIIKMNNYLLVFSLGKE